MSTDVSPAPATRAFKGNDRALLGIVLGVITFWLFAGTIGTIARSVLNDINGGPIDTVPNPLVNLDQMNLVVSVTALFSGLFIVFFGGLADRLGRVRVAITGNVLSIVGGGPGGPRHGQLLPALPAHRSRNPGPVRGVHHAGDDGVGEDVLGRRGPPAGGFHVVDRLVGRLRSWPPSSAASWPPRFNWRVIFYVSIVISVVSIVLIRGIPESKAEGRHKRFDLVGFAIFMVSVLAMMIVLIFGRQMGWDPAADVAARGDRGRRVGRPSTSSSGRKENPFIDFGLFKNTTFTGATLSNFLLNGTIGLLIVSQQMLQIARPELFDPWRAGLLTIGYAVAIIAFIRLGEKLLRRFGPRKPMIWGSMIVALGKHPARADQPARGPVHGSRRHCLHALRYRPGVLRHAVNRRGAVEPASGAGRRRRGHLQDGLLAGWCDRGGPVADHLLLVPR